MKNIRKITTLSLTMVAFIFNTICARSFSDQFVRVQPTDNEADDYFVGKYAVTNVEWQEFIVAQGMSAPSYWPEGNIPDGRERHPVLWVSAEEAQSYCQWLRQKYPDYVFSLPTEEEWEFAAVGNTGYDYPWGSDAGVTYKDGVLTSRFNFNAVIAAKMLETPDMPVTFYKEQSLRYNETAPVGDVISITVNGGVNGWINHNDYTGFVYTDVFRDINDAGGYTCTVDDYPDGISPWGAYNMCGNCWEWTSTVKEAQNGAEKGQMVNAIKGGSWYATKASCRATFQGEGRKASGRYATVGIRILARPVSSTGIYQPVAPIVHPKKYNYSLDGKPRSRPMRGVNIEQQESNSRKIIR